MTKKKLKSIPQSGFARSLSLARMTVGAGARAASHAIGGLLEIGSDASRKQERVQDLLMSQVSALARELGQLKGSLMKVGQMLSMYGEHFFPPEVNAVLKSLQSQSPPLDWPEIEKVLKRQLGLERLAELEIEHDPVASASLGQVHRARRRSDGRVIALKVQYPGVDQAIESDITTLKRILSVSKLVPRGHDYEDLFREVRQMLHQEVDYRKELATTIEFRRLLAADTRFIVPEVFPEYSSARVLATSFEEGVAIDGPEVRAISQERRDRLGGAALELLLREFFEWRMVQTDPHFGNFRVRLSESGVDRAMDRIVLLDFGAVRRFPKDFVAAYREMVRGVYDGDCELLLKALHDVGFAREGDTPEMLEDFVRICTLVMEPYRPAQSEVFDWGRSDLPERVLEQGKKLAFAARLRPPPREVVFLDRKAGGVYILLKVLGARIDGRALLEPRLAAR